MELYRLRTFLTGAEEDHLTRAAEKSHTSQPAAREAIQEGRKLERPSPPSPARPCPKPA